MTETTADPAMSAYIKNLLDYAEKRWPGQPDQWRRFAQDNIRDRLMMDDMEKMLDQPPTGRTPQREVKDILAGYGEMVEGFRDGYDLSAPEPSANRSHSYRHGFANGRDDRSGKPRATAAELIRMADLAMELDRNIIAMD